MGGRTTDPLVAAPTPGGIGRRPPLDDLESVLTEALGRLLQRTGGQRAVVWLPPWAGPPLAAGAATDAVPPPSDEEFAALAALEGPRDLAEPRLAAAVLAAARRHGFAAAAPVGGGAHEVVAIGLLDGPEPAGSVRPRTLAALEETARNLEAPIGAALAARRLARLDGDVRRLDRLAGIGALVAEIVHEVRNPLVSVKTFLQLLPEHLDDPEFRESFLGVVNEEVQRIERLLEAVLVQARPPATVDEAAAGPAAEALEAVARLLAHRAASAGVTLTVEAPPDLPATTLAGDALRQVLLNLAINALEATPRGGDVRLSARVLGHALEVSVADRGPGVPPELRARVFEPFFSTKPERPGGLGLGISRRVVEEAGGTLSVVDRPGGGAVFRARLPVP